MEALTRNLMNILKISLTWCFLDGVRIIRAAGQVTGACISEVPLYIDRLLLKLLRPTHFPEQQQQQSARCCKQQDASSNREKRKLVSSNLEQGSSYGGPYHVSYASCQFKQPLQRHMIRQSGKPDLMIQWHSYQDLRNTVKTTMELTLGKVAIYYILIRVHQCLQQGFIQRWGPSPTISPPTTFEVDGEQSSYYTPHIYTYCTNHQCSHRFWIEMREGGEDGNGEDSSSHTLTQPQGNTSHSKPPLCGNLGSTYSHTMNTARAKIHDNLLYSN